MGEFNREGRREGYTRNYGVKGKKEFKRGEIIGDMSGRCPVCVT